MCHTKRLSSCCNFSVRGYGETRFMKGNDMNEELKEMGMEHQNASPESRDKITVDGKEFHIHTHRPTVEQILALVDRKLCAYELIELFHDGNNREVEPGDAIDLHHRGQHGFITAHRELVTIFIKGDPFEVKRGSHTVNQILGLVGLTSKATTSTKRSPTARRCPCRKMRRSRSLAAKFSRIR